MNNRMNVLFILAFLLTGCGGQIEDFVESGAKRVTDLLPVEVPTSSTTTSNPIGRKISPGANYASGTQVTARISITPTNRLVTGTQVQGRITASQSRAE